jgi:hypothetical protein
MKLVGLVGWLNVMCFRYLQLNKEAWTGTLSLYFSYQKWPMERRICMEHHMLPAI